MGCVDEGSGACEVLGVAGARRAGQSRDQEAEGHQVEVRGHRDGERGTRRRVR